MKNSFICIHCLLISLILVSCGKKNDSAEKMQDYFLTLPITSLSGMDEEQRQSYLDMGNVFHKEDGFFELETHLPGGEVIFSVQSFDEGAVIGVCEYVAGGTCDGFYRVEFFIQDGSDRVLLEDKFPYFDSGSFWEGDIPGDLDLYNFATVSYQFLRKDKTVKVSLQPRGDLDCFAMDFEDVSLKESKHKEICHIIETRQTKKFILEWDSETKEFKVTDQVFNEEVSGELTGEGNKLTDKEEIIGILKSFKLAPYGDINTKPDYCLHQIKLVDGNYQKDPCGKSSFFISLGPDKSEEKAYLSAFDKNDFPVLLIFSPFDSYYYSIKEVIHYENERRLLIGTNAKDNPDLKEFEIYYDSKLVGWVYQFSEHEKYALGKDIGTLKEYKKTEPCHEGDEHEESIDFEAFNIEELNDIVGVKWIEVDTGDYRTVTGSKARVIFKKDKQGYYYYHDNIICNYEDDIESFVVYCDEEAGLGDCYSINIWDKGRKLTIFPWVFCAHTNDDQVSAYKRVD